MHLDKRKNQYDQNNFFSVVPFVLLCFLLISCGDADKIIQSLMDISGAPLKYDDSQATRRLAIASACLGALSGFDDKIR